MTKKRRSAQGQDTDSTGRSSLPGDLQERLHVVWQQLGHLIDWCDSSAAWTRLFCAEPRPFRETFYWEAIARIVSQYTRQHPAVSPEDVLTDCLIATQCPVSADDHAALLEFRATWQRTLLESRAEIDTFRQSDLELARQEGNYEKVASLYAADDWAGEAG